MSSISINTMSRAYTNYPKSCGTNTNIEAEQTFASKVMQMAENGVAEVSKTKAVSTKDMTPEEYKQYIHNEISQIPLHPSRMSESISLNISDAGFEAMQNDPEYEAWVLNDLRVGWSQSNPWAAICGGAFSTIYYGATKEECHAEMWSPGYGNGNGEKLFNQKAGNSFWERRAERKKQLQEIYEEQQEKIHRNQKYFDELAMQKSTAHNLAMQIWNRERVIGSNSVASSEKGNGVISAQVIASYEANVITVSPSPDTTLPLNNR